MRSQHPVDGSEHGVRVVAALVGALALIAAGSPTESPRVADDAIPQERTGDRSAQELLNRFHCPCGCRNRLPGSEQEPACFGCSVGKAEVTFIRESLAAGRSMASILVALQDPTLIEVFADYDDARLPALWQRVRAIASELGAHRVVLRTPGETSTALSAVMVAECGRGSGRFSALQARLVAHAGPWSQKRLIALSTEAGVDPEGMRHCLARIEIGAQVQKDREHAFSRGVLRFPAVMVDRVQVRTDAASLREAIRAARAGETI